MASGLRNSLRLFYSTRLNSSTFRPSTRPLLPSLSSNGVRTTVSRRHLERPRQISTITHHPLLPVNETIPVNTGGHAKHLLPLLANRDERTVICEASDLERVVDICVASFAGDVNQSCNQSGGGEGSFRWIYGAENTRSEVPGQFNPKYIGGLRWYMELFARAALKHGSVIGCKDPESGELMGVTLAFHPDSMVDGEAMPLSRVASTALLEMRSLPRELYRLDQYGLFPLQRLVQAKEAAEEAHAAAPLRHWYVQVLACDPKHAGKRVGSALLNTVIDLSRLEPGVPTYLECHAAKRTYYDKFMACASSATLRNPDPDSPDGDAVLHGFLSEPVP